jgi:hypothetical protein
MNVPGNLGSPGDELIDLLQASVFDCLHLSMWLQTWFSCVLVSKRNDDLVQRSWQRMWNFLHIMLAENRLWWMMSF